MLENELTDKAISARKPVSKEPMTEAGTMKRVLAEGASSAQGFKVHPEALAPGKLQCWGDMPLGTEMLMMVE